MKAWKIWKGDVDKIIAGHEVEDELQAVVDSLPASETKDGVTTTSSASGGKA